MEAVPEVIKQDSNQMQQRGKAPDNIYLLCYAFNQDASCFVCGTTAGFRVFRVSPVVSELIRQENSSAFKRSVEIVAMLYQTSLFAMVTSSSSDSGSSAQHVVQIWDEAKRKFVGEVRSRHGVKGIVMRRDIIAMVCESCISVYSLDRLKHVMTLTTHDNPKGLCASVPAKKPWILCFPGPSKGAVRVQVGTDDAHVFQAHETELAVLALNELGTRLATASEFGSVVKVFQLDGQLLYRLRVGPPVQQVISSISFRPDDSFLAVAVASASVVHIFRVADDDGKQEAHDTAPDRPSVPPGGEDVQDKRGLSSLLSGAMKGAMPSLFGDARSFGCFKLPDTDPTFDTRSSRSQLVGPVLAFHRSEPKVVVLHHSGMVYEAKFHPTDSSQGCVVQSTTAWFQVRPDFRVRDPQQQQVVEASELGEPGLEDTSDEWQVL